MYATNSNMFMIWTIKEYNVIVTVLKDANSFGASISNLKLTRRYHFYSVWYERLKGRTHNLPVHFTTLEVHFAYFHGRTSQRDY